MCRCRKILWIHSVSLNCRDRTQPKTAPSANAVTELHPETPWRDERTDFNSGPWVSTGPEGCGILLRLPGATGLKDQWVQSSGQEMTHLITVEIYKYWHVVTDEGGSSHKSFHGLSPEATAKAVLCADPGIRAPGFTYKRDHNSGLWQASLCALPRIQ